MVQEIFEKILNRSMEWPREEGEELSADCRDLIDKLLCPDPEKRLGHRGAGEVTFLATLRVGSFAIHGDKATWRLAKLV